MVLLESNDVLESQKSALIMGHFLYLLTITIFLHNLISYFKFTLPDYDYVTL